MKITVWLKRAVNLRIFTTRVLIYIFTGGFFTFSIIAYFFNPDGMLGNIVAELVGLCLAAIVVELLLIARDEQSKNEYEKTQNNAVSLNLTQNTDKGRSLVIFLNSLVVSKIKDPSLYLKFNNDNGESWSSVKLTQGEFSSVELALLPLTTEEELNDAISKSAREPDELVLKWTDQHNVGRERIWTIKHLRLVQKSLKGKHDIFSASL